MKILKFNIDNSTDVEKSKLDQCITKIQEITDNYKNSNWREFFDSVRYPPIIENYLKNQNRLNRWNEDSRLWLLSDLFDYYSKNSRDARETSEWNDWITSKMIINDLYIDLIEVTSGRQSETAAKRENEEEEKKDKENANNLLKGAADLRPPNQ